MISEQQHPVERIMDNAFTKMKKLVEADTVIGTPVVTADGVSIIPVSKITAGFLTGGGEYSDMSRQNYSEYPFAGGSGAGVSVSPIGFLVSDGKTVKLVGVDEKNPIEKILETVPSIVEGLLEGVKNK